MSRFNWQKGGVCYRHFANIAIAHRMMSKYHEEIERLKDPTNIKEALYASGPYTLMKAFKNDEIVSDLIKGGREVIPIIAEELKENSLELNEITLSCFAYILGKVDPDSGAEILKPLFIEAMKSPDPFFVNFAAHVLRQNAKMIVKTNDPLYTKGELLETLERVGGR